MSLPDATQHNTRHIMDAHSYSSSTSPQPLQHPSEHALPPSSHVCPPGRNTFHDPPSSAARTTDAHLGAQTQPPQDLTARLTAHHSNTDCVSRQSDSVLTLSCPVPTSAQMRDLSHYSYISLLSESGGSSHQLIVGRPAATMLSLGADLEAWLGDRGRGAASCR